ncbi:MAG TPA: ABC transporter ATP-binding protein [Selenomonadales bacterium]|nr:ABC transporter ATP-binding protein [Selenomonadales bacterium]
MKEERKEGMARLLALAGEKKPLLVWSMVLSTVSVFLLLVPYVAVYYVLIELLQHAADLSGVDAGYLWRWAAWGVGGMAAGYCFMYAGGMCSHIAAFRILYDIRVRLAEHIGALPLGYFNKNATGKIKKIVELDVDRIELFIAHQLPDLVNTVVMIAAIILVMFYMDAWLALAGVIPLLLGFAFQYSMLAGQQKRANLKEYFDALESINSSSIQYVRGMPAIKIFGQTVRSFRKFYDDMLHYRDFCVRYTDNFQNGYVAFKTVILSLATFIMPAGLFFLSGDPANMAFAATLIFFLVLAPGISVPIFKLSTLAYTVTTIDEGLQRIDAILAEETVREPESGQKPSSYDVEFRDVSFSYDGQNGAEVLKKISFTARQGEITALVGPSGSGKSTVAQLIPRFWDVQQGRITIGGVDIRDMKMNDLMDAMSFVFQDAFLFADTLFNNILAGKPAATREEVYAAARAAQCHAFIERLPQGYDTLIGEGGVYLSGGEEQRVSVARAILKNAPILILDEATAYADPENEYHMQLALQELIRGKTILIIAHRLATIREAQQILVLNQGKIDGSGTHDGLLARGGLYKNMWDANTFSTDWQIDHSQGKEAG